MSGMVMRKSPNEELKPCPFCGGEASIVFRKLTERSLPYLPYEVWCSDCEATMTGFETRDEANEAWNKRTDLVKYGKWEEY